MLHLIVYIFIILMIFGLIHIVTKYVNSYTYKR